MKSRNIRSLSIFVFVLAMALQLPAYSQELLPVEIGRHKAVHLIFPTTVKYYDAGVKDVKMQLTGNILKLTAAKESLPETNLTVITEDNYLYSFLILYSKSPRRLTIVPDQEKARLLNTPVAANTPPAQPPATLTAGTATETAPAPSVVAAPEVKAAPEADTSEAPETFSDSTLYQLSLKGMGQRKGELLLADNSKGVRLKVENIFVSGNYLFISVAAQNFSDEDLTIDFINFQQGDRKGLWRDLYREELKRPVYIANKKSAVAANKGLRMVYVFEKFSIDQGKKLFIELREKDGERFFSLPVAAHYINEAPNISL